MDGFLVLLPSEACCFGWIPCPLAILSLLFWMASLSTCHMELVVLGGFLVHLPSGSCSFGWFPCPLAIWSLLFGWLPCPLVISSLLFWLASLSTCHLELVVLVGFLVLLPSGTCSFGWLPCPLAIWSLSFWEAILLRWRKMYTLRLCSLVSVFSTLFLFVHPLLLSRGSIFTPAPRSTLKP